MTSGLPWSEKFISQLAEKEDRDEFVADQVRLIVALSIRALREQRGMSQAEFGKLIGKPQSVVSRLEDPDYGKVSLQTLLEVAAALDLPLAVHFPEWEDWFRWSRRVQKKDLERRDFCGVAQTAAAEAFSSKIIRFPVGSGDFSLKATASVSAHTVGLQFNVR